MQPKFMAFRFNKLYELWKILVYPEYWRYELVSIKPLHRFHIINGWRVFRRSSKVHEFHWFRRVVPDTALSEHCHLFRMPFWAVLVSANKWLSQ